MDFDFDPAKSAANLEKHGIDFIGAQALWTDPDRLEIPARSLDEPRTQVIGRIALVWSAFITLRGDRIRIISVRRARDEEEAAYSKTKARSAAELDAMHDADVDLSANMDLGKAVRPGRAVQRVNVDFPVDILREIDQEARRLGVTRQAFIKVQLADSLVKSH